MGVKHSNGSFMSTTPRDFEDVPHVFENFYTRAILILIYAVVFLACFVGNLGVIVILALQWKSKSLLRFCLWNLSLANLLVALFCIMHNLSLCLLGTWIFGEVMCKMYHFITTLYHSASIIITTLLSVKRYQVLVHPDKFQQFLTARTTLQLLALATWILSAGISLPRFIFFGLLKTERHEQGHFGEICAPANPMYNSATADLIYFIVQYLLPVVTLVVLYCRIGLLFWNSERIQREYYDKSTRVDFKSCSASIVKARFTRFNPQNVCNNSPSPEVLSLSAPNLLCRDQERLSDVRMCVVGGYVEGTVGFPCPDRSSTSSSKTHRRRAFDSNFDYQSFPNSYSRTLRSKSRRKDRRLLMIIVVTFVVLNLPYHVRKLCINFCPSFDIASETNKLLTPVTFLLMYINCAVNSIVCAFSSKAFRANSREFWSKLSRIVGENYLQHNRGSSSARNK